jgi:hypothetical protein
MTTTPTRTDTHPRVDCGYPAGCTGCRHQNPTDDLRVTVDRLAAISSGQAVVTLKFSIDADFFADLPTDQWTAAAVAQALQRHAAERMRYAERQGGDDGV